MIIATYGYLVTSEKLLMLLGRNKLSHGGRNEPSEDGKKKRQLMYIQTDLDPCYSLNCVAWWAWQRQVGVCWPLVNDGLSSRHDAMKPLA
ncbi:hypothetical protein EVAR_91874_1 [Eumeta japonica]|uniref:Uncharacterized protein n=1 Tax=Eumeta variegata TaxID=151549 RepID=A0A4C1SYT3_EUMVA|nr:hypothetical protein EVAR_91874_1 [Eumeta japonica]